MAGFDLASAKSADSVFDLESAKPAQAKPQEGASAVDKINSLLQRVHGFTPAGIAMQGMHLANDALEKGAYDVGGAVTDATGSPAAGYAANVGVQALPVLAGAGAGKIASPALERAGIGVMQRALKPSTAIPRADVERGIRTIMDEGVNATAGGARNLREGITANNARADEIISGSQGYVKRAVPEAELAATREKYAVQATPESDLKAIDKVGNEFSRRHAADIDVQRAQKIKQNTYKILEGKYGEQGSAATEAQKSLARGLRKGIEEVEPAVAPVNARTRDLIRALDLVEPRAAMAGNRDVAGLSLLANNPKTAALMMADRSQLVKSLIARGLYNTNATYPGAAAGALYGLNTGTE